MDTWWWLPALALAAGFWALAPLGVQVLRRGVVFMDLAVAQAAAAVVVGVHAAWPEAGPLWLQLAAMLGAVLASVAVAGMARRWPAQREALIGLLYVGAASLALLGAGLDPHGKEHLLALLAADVLWVSPQATAGLCVGAVLVALWGRVPAAHADRWFYLAFAGVVSWAVPALGLFVVFGALMAPALWIARGGRLRTAMALAMAIGALALGTSWLLDLGSGPTVALALAGWGLLSLVRAPGAHSTPETPP